MQASSYTVWWVNFEGGILRFSWTSLHPQNLNHENFPVTLQVMVLSLLKNGEHIEDILFGTWPWTLPDLFTATAKSLCTLSNSLLQSNSSPTAALHMCWYSWSPQTIDGTSRLDMPLLLLIMISSYYLWVSSGAAVQMMDPAV